MRFRCTREVERLIGLLIWFTAGVLWLRLWLSNFCNLLYKPSVIPRLFSIDYFQELVSSRSQDLKVLRPLKQCDICVNWQLCSVANLPVSGLALGRDTAVFTAFFLISPTNLCFRMVIAFFNRVI